MEKERRGEERRREGMSNGLPKDDFCGGEREERGGRTKKKTLLSLCLLLQLSFLFP